MTAPTNSTTRQSKSVAQISVNVRVKPPQPLDCTALDFASSCVTGSDQQTAFDAIAAPLLARMRQGYSSTLLAYGQTGSGKTHTMFGPPGSLTEANLREAGGAVPESWGLLPRAALELLRSGGTIHASAVEVYQERAYDLLSDRSPLTVGTKSGGRKVGAGAVNTLGDASQKAHHGTHPHGCRCGKCWKAQQQELAARIAKRDNNQNQQAAASGRSARIAAAAAPVEYNTVGETLWKLETAADVARLARTVEITRVAAGHALNARSSRSHCLVHLHYTENVNGKVSRWQLVVVDLAGSERISKSGVEGDGKKQATAINASLTVLGKVVRALGRHDNYVPYRESTLTMLLRSSFGGKSCTSVVINVAAEHPDETSCSLEFGRRLTVVKNKATRVVGQDAGAQASRMQQELASLKAALITMETDGHAGRFGDNAVASEKAAFLDNQRKMAAEEARTMRLRTQLAEGRSTNITAEELNHLQTQSESAAFSVTNLRDILMRQRSIKGFWYPPSKT